jgi:hypothetical protein
MQPMKRTLLLLKKTRHTLFTGLSLFSLLTLISVHAKAENIITTGTTLKIVAGTTMVSSESLTIKSGAILDNAGTIILKKNLTNENPSSNSLGSGIVSCTGTVSQSINGSNIIQNLTVNNSAGVINGGENRINGVLTLTSGLVTLGINNLTLGTSASVAGTPSASAMIVATGSGEIRKLYGAAGSFLFPVGDNNGTAEYSPVTLNFTSGTFPVNSYAGVKLTNTSYPGGPGGSYLNRYWNINQSGITSYSCNATFKYVPADVTGTESSIYTVRISPSAVDYFSIANTAADQLTANNLTSFGTFTGYQSLPNNNASLSLFLEGLYNGGGVMRKAQNASGDQFPGTTADRITIELHNAASYSSIAYTIPNVNLSTTGGASATFPGILSGSYYVTIKHRNSLETTSALPVTVSGGTITYNFTDAASKAFGNNMKAVAGGFFAIYGADITQDRIVDGSDMAIVDNSSTAAVTGYVAEDATGDGLVDGSDMAIVDNNSTSATHAILP